jgi:hypothetical protein
MKNKETEEIEEIETIDDTLAKIRKSGLCIKIVNPSSTESKEHCAYQKCNEVVKFTMESLLVCQKHAVSLMHCFIPDCKPKD